MIPNKSNFKFNELTPITGVKPYVIRFWETEFTDISPMTSDSGQKIYARKDVETILKIKKLLFEEKLSIPEARARMQTAEVELASGDEINEVMSVEVELLSALSLIKNIKSKHNW